MGYHDEFGHCRSNGTSIRLPEKLSPEVLPLQVTVLKVIESGVVRLPISDP